MIEKGINEDGAPQAAPHLLNCDSGQ